MKKLLSIIAFIILGILTACPWDTEPNPPVIESCNDGIKNQDETGIDCGGKCLECFDCFSDFCVFLSGGTFTDDNTSITWKCTDLDGEPFVYDNCPDDLVCQIYNTLKMKFENKGGAELTTTEGFGEGSWKFDDPEEPTKVTIEMPEDLPIGTHIFDIVSLEEDVLIISAFGVEGTFRPI